MTQTKDQILFPVNDHVCYLNHAAVAPWSAGTADTVKQFAEESAKYGATHYPRWLQTDAHLRENLRQLLNAQSTEEIALVKNTSEGLSFIASGIEWEAGDEIVITNQEFPSNRIVWEALSNRGVTVTEVDVSDFATASERLCSAISAKTKLVSVSAVQYASGLRLALAAIGAKCKATNTLFCVDAIQSLGVIPMDCQHIQSDFIVADGHKWLLGPEGLGVLYIRQPLVTQLALTEYGWHMVKERGNYDKKEWEPAQDAKRFECGSPNLLCAHALNHSLTELLNIGISQIEILVSKKVQILIDALKTIPGCTILSPEDAHLRAGIVTFRVDGVDTAALYRHLMACNVICAHRGGGIRFSPHFHTPDERLTEAVTQVNAFSKS